MVPRIPYVSLQEALKPRFEGKEEKMLIELETGERTMPPWLAILSGRHLNC